MSLHIGSGPMNKAFLFYCLDDFFLLARKAHNFKQVTTPSITDEIPANFSHLRSKFNKGGLEIYNSLKLLIDNLAWPNSLKEGLCAFHIFFLMVLN